MSTPEQPPTEIQEGPLPKHAQLRIILEEYCRNELSPGDPLPGERALEETYNVSRITVRRAIGDLVAQGKLRRVRGKGTFVAPSPLVSKLQLASFSEEMQAQGVVASSNILLSERAVAPREVTEYFGTPPHAEHIHLRRLRLGDAQPYAVDDGWYNGELVPDLLEHDLQTSVYQVLDQRYGLSITEAEQTVTAVNADARVATLLDVPANRALLRIVRYAQSHGTRVEYCASVYRTDRYSLHTQVLRNLEG